MVKLLLTVVIFAVFVVPVLLTVVRLLLTVVIFAVFVEPVLLTVVRLLLIVVIFAVFVAPALLTVVRFVLTVVNAVAIGRLVRRDPSPINFPNRVPAEIVEKKPYVVDIVIAEILDTVRR